MRQFARAFADALERRLARVAPRAPRVALSLGDGIGRLRCRLSGRWPSPEEIHALFPELTLHETVRVASRIGGIEARNRVLVGCIRSRGPRHSPSLVPHPPPELTRLRAPAILGFFHVGAFQALGAVLEWLPGPVLAFRHGLLTASRPPVTVLSTEGSDQERAAVFLRALTHLGSGGFVATAFDEVPGRGVRVPVLGRPLELARGPFALSRLSRAPLIPLAARWHGGTVTVEIGEPLTPDRSSDPNARETAQATAAARWLEAYLRRAPEQVGLGLLLRLLEPPAAAPAVSGPVASS